MPHPEAQLAVPPFSELRGETIVSRLRALREQRDKPGFVFLLDGEDQKAELSYGELDERARALAAALAESVSPGERALLLLPPGLDFITAFFGCLYAGVIAVPAYPPDPTRLGRTLPRLQAIAQDAEVAAVLGHSAVEALLGNAFEETRRALPGRWIAADQLDPELGRGWSPPTASVDAVALLQYTSGSTALPKGVALSHGNLIQQASQLAHTCCITTRSVFLCWLPPYHDMGLVGAVLTPVIANIPSTMMSPISFLQRPARWLSALSRHRATHTAAPNFGYELALRRTTNEEKATLDLGSLETAACGAEPISAATIERFFEAFRDQGLRREAFAPCYGLAEATLMVTFKPHSVAARRQCFDRDRLAEGVASVSRETDGNSRELAGCGAPNPETRVRIVDPQTCAPLPDGAVGEIWVAGGCVGLGYWNRPEETRATFGARLAESDEGPFLRTGDLGFLQDGDLFVTGRSKDLVVIRGRNLHPEDVEQVVDGCHPALRPGSGAAFGVWEDEQEQLALVHEIHPRYDGDLDEVVAAMRGAVSESHQVAVHAIALVEARTIPKTSSGKIQRHACRRALEEGTLDLLQEWRNSSGLLRDPELEAEVEVADSPAEGSAPTASAIEAWLVEQIAVQLSVDPRSIDRHGTLTDYGLDSLAAVSIAAELENWLGRRVAPSLAWDFPTVAELADHLASGTQAASYPAESGDRARMATEPVAVVGYGCRFPGAESPESFWELLRSGADAIQEVPSDRWDVERYYDEKPGTPGKMNTRWGGFLDRVDRFDPVFFGISRREAEWMDPQHRLLLEVAWEAFEHASTPPSQLAGTRTGVFVGIGSVDYSHLMQKFTPLDSVSAYAGTGNAHSIAANRLSYLFDLRGPSLAVDTACSSSLVAIHLACQSLWTGESECALAGGVNLILAPDISVAFSQARMLASDGRCKTFDAAANGYVRSEGAGMVMLKRLSDALRDGDRVLGVIRGTAVNQDGRTPGITAPRREAQKGVIREALRQAGVAAEEIDYVEAHGTGTEIGDPIEVGALVDVLGRSPAAPPCRIGSVKANIGHAETASGIAGLIKLLLCFEHDAIPAQLHLERPNPHLSLEQSGLEIPTELLDWPRGERPRLASVSSFGFGGTNAHLIVQEAASPVSPRQHETDRPRHLLALSARTQDSLLSLVERFERHLGTHENACAGDICFSANVGRSQQSERLAVTGETLDELRGGLRAFRAGERHAALQTGTHPGREEPRLAMLFTGQGSQYSGMAQGLYRAEPAFRRSLDRCAAILDSQLERPLLEVLFDGGASRLLDQTAYTQPALFAVEVSLASLWRSWGVQPDVVLGHSVGEYSAACVAGVFSLEDGLRLIAERGRLMQSVTSTGAMAALMTDEESARRAIEPFAESVSLAAVNAPGSVVISGALEDVESVVAALEGEGVRARRLQVSHAFHSPLLEPILDEFERFAEGFGFAAPRIPLVSNLTGELLEEIPDARYWRRHARETVRFADGMGTLSEPGCDAFLEVGPHPTLLGLARACLGGGRAGWFPSLRRGANDWGILLDTLARLYCAGIRVDWRGFDESYERRKVSLPTYAFDRERYWIDAQANAASEATGAALAGPVLHPLLGRQLRSALEMRQYESSFGVGSLPYLADHRVQGSTVVPAAAYLGMASAAARELFEGEAELEDVSFQKALFLPHEGDRKLQLVVYPPAAGVASFQIFSLATGNGSEPRTWTEHAAGRIRAAGAPGDDAADEERLEAIRERCRETVAGPALYDELRERGLDYGPSFRGVEEVWRRDGEALGRLHLPGPLASGETASDLHPALLDACFHVVAAAVPRSGAESARGVTYLPAGLGHLGFFRTASRDLFSHCTLRDAEGSGLDALAADVRIFDDQGRIVAEAQGLRLLRLGGTAGALDDAPADWRYALRWHEEPALEPPSNGEALESGVWLVFADQGGGGERLAKRLVDAGHATVLATRSEGYARRGDALFQLDPGRPEDYEQLLDEALPAGHDAFAGVVYAWALDVPSPVADLERLSEDARTLSAENPALLVRALARTRHRTSLVFLTAGAQPVPADPGLTAPGQAPLWGLGRVVALEHPELCCRRIDLGGEPAELEWDSLARELLTKGNADEVALCGARRFVPRLERIGSQEEGEAAGAPDPALRLPAGESYCLESSASGRLDKLHYRPAPRVVPPPGAVEIEVTAAGLNFRDVLNGMGLYPGGPIPFGNECTGYVSALGEDVTGFEVGDAVLAVAPASFARYAVTSADLVVPKPASLNFEEAATIPITFLTAHYALSHLARLGPGERILVHAGAGGVGLAAIQLAKRVGAEIFATAGSPEKRAFLTSLGVEHCMDSRSLEFADEIMEITGGRGVDVVLNSLPGEFITRSLAVLAPYGRFVEIGRTDIYQNRQIGLLPFQNNLSYFAVDLEKLCRERSALAHRLFDELNQAFAEGSLRPLPHKVFAAEEVVGAFRYMAQRRNIGKIVVSMGAPEAAETPSEPSGIHADATYLVTGGCGGLGLTLARWLAERGARHLVLLSRSGAGREAESTLETLRQEGVTVVVARADVADRGALAQTLSEIRGTLPPLRGVVHAAGLIEDGLLARLELEQFRAVFAPKLTGAWNLHLLTHQDPLDFLVFFSSVASVLGSPGQGNYAAANAFLDALAHHRHALGLPATSIEWGPWAEVGMAARGGLERILEARGMRPMAPDSALEALEEATRDTRPQTLVASIDWPRLLAGLGETRRSELLVDLAAECGDLQRPSENAGRGAERVLDLAADERQGALMELIQSELATIMGLELAELETDEPLVYLGLDSLMAIELKERLESSLGVTVGIEHLVEDPTIRDVAEIALEELTRNEETCEAVS